MTPPPIVFLDDYRAKETQTCPCGSAWFATTACFGPTGSVTAYTPIFTRCIECGAGFTPRTEP